MKPYLATAFKILGLFLILFIFLTSTSIATINVVINSPGYIVFAAEGRTTHLESNTVISDNWGKILFVKSNLMVMTGGQTSYDKNNQIFYLDDWFKTLKKNSKTEVDIDSITLEFSNYLDSIKNEGGKFHDFQIWIAGTDFKNDLRLYCFRYKNEILKDSLAYSVYCIGSQGTSRLFYGLDHVFRENLEGSLSNYLDDSVLNTISYSIDTLRSEHALIVDRYVYEAIEQAYVIVRASIAIDRLCVNKYSRSSDISSPKTGGYILEAILTKEKGVRWIIGPDYTPEWPKELEEFEF